MKALDLVKETARGQTIPEEVTLGVLGFSSGLFLYSKCFNCLTEKARRNLLAVQAVALRPVIRIVVRSKKLIDPRKVDGKVLINALFLRGMVPMMISGHDEEFFQPFRTEAEIAVGPGSVEG